MALIVVPTLVYFPRRRSHWAPYAPDVTTLLEDQYQRNPGGVARVLLGSRPYTVDFRRMVQINDTTGFIRQVMRVPLATALPVTPTSLWEYEEAGRWLPMDIGTSKVFADALAGGYVLLFSRHSSTSAVGAVTQCARPE